jgi:hypothetical protein
LQNLKHFLLIEQKKSKKHLVSPERLLNRIEKLHQEYYEDQIQKTLINQARPGLKKFVRPDQGRIRLQKISIGRVPV